MEVEFECLRAGVPPLVPGLGTAHGRGRLSIGVSDSGQRGWCGQASACPDTSGPPAARRVGTAATCQRLAANESGGDKAGASAALCLGVVPHPFDRQAQFGAVRSAAGGPDVHLARAADVLGRPRPFFARIHRSPYRRRHRRHPPSHGVSLPQENIRARVSGREGWEDGVWIKNFLFFILPCSR